MSRIGPLLSARAPNGVPDAPVQQHLMQPAPDPPRHSPRSDGEAHVERVPESGPSGKPIAPVVVLAHANMQTDPRVLTMAKGARGACTGTHSRRFHRRLAAGRQPAAAGRRPKPSGGRSPSPAGLFSLWLSLALFSPLPLSLAFHCVMRVASFGV
jgi:hypothetical protein